MNGTPYIPRKTRDELATPETVGHRHGQIVKVVSSLIGQGLSPDAVFAELRSKYDASVTNREIADVIRWASGKNFSPCTPRFSGQRIATTSTRPIDPVANLTKFLKGFVYAPADLWEASLWRPLEDYRFDSLMFLAGMFHAGELVNVVTEYTVDANGKANPNGYGLTLERDAMMRYIRDHGTPQSKAGAWLRMNPADGKGITDANITAFRFILLECDDVPLDMQISFFTRLPLPVNAIYRSGGKSIHALVRVNAKSAESYRVKVGEMYDLLRPFGICQGNKNPSRLTRLVGAQREIGATGDGQQRLLYLAPDRRDCKPIFEVNR